jgi:hypothetical protein
MRRILLPFAPAAVLALCLYAVDLPYFVEGPGSAKAVLPLIDIDGTETYSSEGDYLLTTVNIGRVNVFDALAAWLDPAEHLFSFCVIITNSVSVAYEITSTALALRGTLRFARARLPPSRGSETTLVFLSTRKCEEAQMGKLFRWRS